MSLFFFVFIFGTIIGSFLNVVILRYNTGESIVSSRSRCFGCGKKLNWYELIPVLSFVIQEGRCRQCKNKISFQYPVVELLTDLIFLLIFQITRYSLLVTGYYFIVFSTLIIIAVYDFYHQIIPNVFVWVFNVFAFLKLFENWNLRFAWKLIIGNWNFLSGLIFFAFFGLIWLVSRGRAMGFGDAKLALGLGWFLGLFKGFLAVLFSFWVGALVGVGLLVFSKKRYNLRSRISFGPFLVLGIILAFFWGDAIIKFIW